MTEKKETGTASSLEETGGGLRRGTMGVAGMVVAVIAFAAPLAASVGSIPLAIGLGDGAGAPGAWLLAAVVLLLFAVGYAAMSRHMTNAGAFYAYIAAGLGRRAGVAAGYLSVVAYSGMVFAISAFFGYFASTILETELSVHVPWFPLAILGVLIAGVLAFTGIEASVRAMMILLGVETALLVVFDIGTLVVAGPGAYSLQAFSPAETFGGSIGVALAFAFATFIGFEATAVFSEEAKDPKRTVRRATYFAIAVIGVLYIATAWSLIASLGSAGAVQAAQENPGEMMFAAAGAVLGPWAVHLMEVFVVTSVFAVLIATINSSSRYTFSLARDGYLPRPFARTHRTRRTPHFGIVVQTILTIVVGGIYAIAGADPLTQFAATFVGLSTLGIVAMEAVVSLSVIAYFRRHPERSPGVWQAVLAPLLAAAGLALACTLIVKNFALITGSDSPVIARLPYVLVLAAVIGAVVGGRGKRRRGVASRELASPSEGAS
ncbi:APC family permease [Amycolatopsis acidicola]|uniref:APC family permease n=1 Tax=Amycolatopsis acidicola TaxID=2596893 RepID=A0A5N0V5A3_9PSEU|nr:APC family permease [Amycolatopsis acidicola]KAA9160548.1 APC family permease [Amycolatopsis acidicola]